MDSRKLNCSRVSPVSQNKQNISIYVKFQVDIFTSKLRITSKHNCQCANNNSCVIQSFSLIHSVRLISCVTYLMSRREVRSKAREEGICQTVIFLFVFVFVGLLCTCNIKRQSKPCQTTAPGLRSYHLLVPS